MTRYVVPFTDPPGDPGSLGTAGLDLATMASIGLPVPEGFTITTAAAAGQDPGTGMAEECQTQILDMITWLETATRRRMGDPEAPLILSLASSTSTAAPYPLPALSGLGLNDQVVSSCAGAAGATRPWQQYCSFLTRFGSMVMGASSLRQLCAYPPAHLGVEALRDLSISLRTRIRSEVGRELPESGRDQVLLAVTAVHEQWAHRPWADGEDSRSAAGRTNIAVHISRRIPDDLDAAPQVLSALSRDRSTGKATSVETLSPVDARGRAGADALDAAGGSRDLTAEQRARLVDYLGRLETHHGDACGLEFVVTEGQLWTTRSRIAPRSPASSFQIARGLAENGIVDMDQALGLVTGDQLQQLLTHQLDRTASAAVVLTRGQGASAGAASGEAVFSSERSVQMARQGRPVILVMRETTPSDLPAMFASAGILTSHGGTSSHAAVVARGMGRICVAAAGDLEIDAQDRRMRLRGSDVVVHEGDMLTIDGGTGEVYVGRVPMVSPGVLRVLQGEQPAEEGSVEESVMVMLRHADASRRMKVYTNADSTSDVRKALDLGAEGVGLCRIEHMFLGERSSLIQRLLLAETEADVTEVLSEIRSVLYKDLVSLLSELAGRPATIRLIDPPLHEFLPAPDSQADAHRSATSERLREQNPMLGLRGVRTNLRIPRLLDVQVQAVVMASRTCRSRGIDTRAQVLVPFVASAREMMAAQRIAAAALSAADPEGEITLPVGAMIELPRAAMTSREISGVSDFLSFGTNDLTQMTWGFSRDDAERTFLSDYLSQGIIAASPFKSIDRDGVGALMQLTVDNARATRDGLSLGACGEHAVDGPSIAFFDELGLDHISCAPASVPIARLEAGRSALRVLRERKSGSEGPASTK